LQAIFGFGSDGLVNWDDQVCTYFPLAGELNTPWRWINANAEPLGKWLLEVRRKLLSGESIDLRAAPPAVSWVNLDGTEDHHRRLIAARVRPSTSDDPRAFPYCGEPMTLDSRWFTPGAVLLLRTESLDLEITGGFLASIRDDLVLNGLALIEGA
jgi:DNA helicase-2/ATP-dependent DNA helicase PcrA